MLEKTQGIVFHTIKYSDTSIISKIYTRNFGIQSFIVKGIRSSRSKNKASLFQPVNILDLEVYHGKNRNLKQLKDFRLFHIYQRIPFSIVKSSVAMFIMDVLNRIITEEESNEALFDFIVSSLLRFDSSQQGNSDFHLRFLIHLTKYLGFYPEGTFSKENCFFDLKEGIFLHEEPNHPYYLDTITSHNFGDMLLELPLRTSLDQRNTLLEKVLVFYQLHLGDSISKVKSHKILHEILQV